MERKVTTSTCCFLSFARHFAEMKTAELGILLITPERTLFHLQDRNPRLWGWVRSGDAERLKRGGTS